jgi:predicted component of type VI protein secretion system
MPDYSGGHLDLTEEMASLLIKLTERLPAEATEPQREQWAQLRALWVQNLRKLWNTRDRGEISSIWRTLGGDPQILANLCADPAEAERWMRPGSA